MQFCKASSIFEVDNIKNEAILRDFLQKWKVECRADGFVLIRFARLPGKVMPGHAKCCTCHANHLSKLTDLMLQNATHLRKSALGPPSSSDWHVSCTAPATRHASLQILFKCPTPAITFGNATKPSRFSHFWQGAQSLAPATRNDI